MQKLLLCYCILFFTSCSGSELNKDGGDLTRSEVEFLSAKLVKSVEKEYPILQHKLVNRYMNSLGQSIASHNPDLPPLPYEFRVLKSSEVFVFSIPGGIIYITLGALRAVELEGQLAAALAHELAHQQLNHSLIQWRRKVNANRGQQYLLSFEGDWKDLFLGEGGALYLDPGMEEEADRLTPVILYRARFEPRLYTSYLQVLKKLEASSDDKVASMLSLHPPLQKRLDWVKDALANLPPLKDPAVSSQAFQEIKMILREAEKKGTAKTETSPGKKP